MRTFKLPRTGWMRFQVVVAMLAFPGAAVLRVAEGDPGAPAIWLPNRRWGICDRAPSSLPLRGGGPSPERIVKQFADSAGVLRVPAVAKMIVKLIGQGLAAGDAIHTGFEHAARLRVAFGRVQDHAES